jgi:hypothetical protein
MSDKSERLAFLRWKIERLLESRASWGPERRAEYDALTQEEADLLSNAAPI